MSDNGKPEPDDATLAREVHEQLMLMFGSEAAPIMERIHARQPASRERVKQILRLAKGSLARSRARYSEQSAATIRDLLALINLAEGAGGEVDEEEQ